MSTVRSERDTGPTQVDPVADVNPPSPLRLHKLRAQVVQGPNRGLSVDIGARRVVIGRAPGCDLTLTDPTVAPMHVELGLEPAGVFVRNLGARGSVHVGALRIEEDVVDVGTPLQLGRSVVRIERLSEQAELPFAPVRRTGGLVGSSFKMRVLFGLVRQYAQLEAPVLIEGETGTGKELAARAIHDLSPRAHAPFEVFDCGAPAQTLEAELFGQQRGPGESRPGLFERASGGTVVLDDIGDLPLVLQAKLVGVLERGHVRRLGEDLPRRVTARIMATTGRVLAREVQAGRFRQDLYFLLSALRLAVPPLRDRKEDIPLLIDEILGTRHGLPATWLRTLQDHQWPGNVTELRSTLVRAQAQLHRAGGDGAIDFSLGDEATIEDMETARRRFERGYLKSLLTKSGHNVARAARLAGITRQGLYRLLHRHGLGPSRPRKPHVGTALDDSTNGSAGRA